MEKLNYKKRKYNQDYQKKSYYRDAYLALSKVAPQARTDYARSLLNPFLRLPVRIPDLCSYPTAVVTQESHVTWTPNNHTSNTNTNMFLIMITSSFQANAWYSTAQGMDFPGQYGWLTNGATPLEVGVTKIASYKQARVVSAGFRVTFAGNDSNSQGTLRACTYAGGINLTGAGVGTDIGSATVLQQQQDFTQVPLTKGLIGRYAPRDSDDFVMREIKAGMSGTLTNYTDPWCFVIEATGNAANVPLHVDIVVNWEALLGPDGVTQDAAKGPCDPQAAGFGMEVCGALPGIFPGDDDSVREHITYPMKYLQSL